MMHSSIQSLFGHLRHMASEEDALLMFLLI